MSTKSLISYNLNGIRAALKKDFIPWLKANDFDMLFFQETKAQPEQIPVELFEELGYHHYWHSAVKKGYSSVGILSKVKPDQVIAGCGIERHDSEGRIIRADFGDITVINIYFPSGTSGEIRQEYKYEFLDDMFDWIHELRKTRPKIIVCGDYNIAHTENDIHNPKGNKNNSGFLPEERDWMTKWLNSGFTDAYRHLNPKKTEYSWWSYRANARANNKGWRIDYFSVTDNLVDQLVESNHIKEAIHSDHCAVYLKMKWN